MPLLTKYGTNQDVVDFMVTNHFSTSTVTMSPDQYLKRATHDAVIYPALIASGILAVEQDPKQLEYAMFITSGGELYREGALNSAFDGNDASETEPTADTADSTPPEEREEKEAASVPMVSLNIEESKKDLEAHKDSIESIVRIVSNADGIPRAKFIPGKYEGDKVDPDNIDWSAVYSKKNIASGAIRITHPVTLNLDMFKNFDKYVDEKFVNDLFMFESCHLDELSIPVKAFPKEIKDLLSRLPAIMDESILAARASSKNSQLGLSLGDPFADLFGSL